MERPNTLLKVVSIIIIVMSALGIVLGLVVAIMGGAVLGAALESAGVALAVGGTIGVLVIAGSVYELVCGIMGVKGKYGVCKVMGIIWLVLGVISTIGSLFSGGSFGSVLGSILATLLLQGLYVWGAFKGPM